MTTTLLCLHGMDATGAVWAGVADHWRHGPVLAPDLAGHGTAPRLDRYDLESYGRDLLSRVGDDLGDRVVLLGHSMGGAVAVALAGSGRIPEIAGVVALGVKASWTPDELAGLHRVADKGVAHFDDEVAARQRFLRIAGLAGLVDVGSELAASGVRRDGDGAWRLAVDPEVHRLGALDLAALLARVTVPVVLARGDRDEMVPAGDLARFGVPTAEVAGAGHNAHVEEPAGVVALAEAMARG